MNFCSLLDQLHEEMGQQTHVVMFSECDITYLHTHVHALSKWRDGIGTWQRNWLHYLELHLRLFTNVSNRPSTISSTKIRHWLRLKPSCRYRKFASDTYFHLRMGTDPVPADLRWVHMSHKKWLLASSCLYVQLHVSALFPLARFSWNLILVTFMNICQTPNLGKFGQKYQVLYMSKT